MSETAASKFRSIRDFPELVDYLGDELDWPIATDDFEEMTFEYSAAELGLDEKTAPKFLEIRRLRPLDIDQPWGIFFIRFDDNKLPVVALRRLLSKLVLNKRSTSNSGDRASWHESDLLLISQTGKLGTQSISFAHFASNPEKTDLPILKVLGWDDDDTGLKIDYVIETLREKLVWPDDPTDSNAWRAQWRDAFTLKNREVIQSSKEMAERLGRLAVAVRTRMREVLAVESEEGPIHKLMSDFKENLISDLNTDSFSDMYAQTIAYGLLSARIINPKANTVDAAHTQIPITNPFLRDLMETFLNVGGRSHSGGTGLDFDELGINEVVDLLDNSNIEAILRDFGNRNQKEDPVMHFFEGFLQEYDSKIRKDRGVFYTPQPVVSFIVRSVDEQLRTELGLEDGLADTTTWGELAERRADLEIPEGISSNQAFVQILDPATGTGTFPVEVIDLIYKTMSAKWQSQGKREAQILELWNDYVPRCLLPRLHGYELMMAPYAIAHMKIGLKLHETGYRFKSDERARVYLTNALESAQDFSETLAFAIPALALEAEAANTIKRKQPFTVLIGNPPYLGEGGVSKGWIGDLIADYKKEPGGKEVLKERTSKWLNDLYVKFLRVSEYFIEKNNAGVMGFITNNGYLANPTFRGVRWYFQNVFNKILILDLHGNTKKNETTPQGKPDQNVFDIQQGVSIVIAVKKNLFSEGLAELFHADLWGERNSKYLQLSEQPSSSIIWQEVALKSPFYLFTPFNYEAAKEYDTWMPLTNIFNVHGTGVVSARDDFVIDFTKESLVAKMEKFIDKSVTNEEVIKQFNLKESNAWAIADSRDQLREAWSKQKNKLDFVCPILYRPFDARSIFYHQSVVHRPKLQLMSHIKDHENLGICSTRAVEINQGFSHIFATQFMTQHHTVSIKEVNYHFSLYCYDEEILNFESNHQIKKNRFVNISNKFINDISISSSLHYKEGSKSIHNEFSEKDLLGYIYAILHSPIYRNKFEPSLRIDFPRLPSNPSEKVFIGLASFGQKLISLHVNEFKPVKSAAEEVGLLLNSEVEKVSYSDETVWIDISKSKGFKGVTEDVWNFSIGGYQVCKKWLGDREPKKGNPGRVLAKDDIAHYKYIIFAITETIRIMAEIDKLIDAHGGWPNAFITAET